MLGLGTATRMSVRRRLTLTIALATALGLVAVGGTMYVVESRRIDRAVMTALTVELDQMRAFAETGEDPSTSTPFASPDALVAAFLERTTPAQDEVLLGFPGAGSPQFVGTPPSGLLASADLRAAVDDLRDEGGTAELTVSGREYRLAVLPVTDRSDAAALGVVHDVSATRGPLKDLMITYALLAALVLIVIASVSSWLAGRLLGPLRRLRDTAQGIGDGDLGRRIDVTGHDDISDLQRSFNAMLDRVESAFQTQRHLLDDASHELRTPLTVLRGHLELLDPQDPADVAPTRALLLDEVDRMSRLVGDLLMLAKARRPDFVTPEPVEVADVTAGVVDRSRALADRAWVLDDTAHGTYELDPQRITQAMLQLADNATRHTGPGGVIGIGSRQLADGVELWVRDDGTGVDPEIREDLFDRFARGDRDDEGFGLGLSIVRAIAQAHGGDVSLDDTPRGATFRLHLPGTVRP